MEGGWFDDSQDLHLICHSRILNRNRQADTTTRPLPFDLPAGGPP